MRARDSEFGKSEWFRAPHATPRWLLHDATANAGGSAFVEVDGSALRTAEPFPNDTWKLTPYARQSYLDTFLETPGYLAEARSVFFRAVRRDDALERAILEGIPIRYKGSPVWWTDLDTGPVQAASLFDLALLGTKPQPWKRGRGRKKARELWLLSLEQWDEAEFPPASKGGPPFVKGISTAAERRRRRRTG